jgi:hypothetical protein
MNPSGAGTYVYQGGSATVSPSSTTAYTVTGTSTAGCLSASAVGNITVAITPTVTINSGTACTGQAFVLNPSGAFSYSYSGGGATVFPSSSTSYTVTGTSAAGCVGAPAICNVTVYATPTVNVNSGMICSGQPFIMTPTGASIYNYSSGSATVFPVVNSSYTVTGTSAQGCVGTNSAISSVTVNSTPTISVISGSVCSGKSFTIVPSGAFLYVYSSGSPVVSPASNTLYFVTGTSAQGCVSSNTAVCAVTVVASPTVAVTGGTVCSGNSYTISPTGASSYTFSSGNAVVTPAGTSTFFVVGSNPGGCTSNSAICTVTVHSLPVLTIQTTNSVMCEGETVTITVSGASQYLWSNGGNLNAIVVSPTVSMGYSVTGIDANGCAKTGTFAQNVDPCLGIRLQEESWFIVYPNPNEGKFAIKSPVNGQYTITDNLGQTVMQFQLPAGENEVSLGECAKGIYFISASLEGTTRRVKLIKE